MATTGSNDVRKILFRKRVVDPITRNEHYYEYRISETSYISLKESKGSGGTKYRPEPSVGFPEARIPEHSPLAKDLADTDGGYPVWARNQNLKGPSPTFRRYLKNPRISLAAGDDLFRRMFVPYVHGYKTDILKGTIVKQTIKQVNTDTDLPDIQREDKLIHHYDFLRYEYGYHYQKLYRDYVIDPCVDESIEGILPAEEAFEGCDPAPGLEDIRCQIQQRLSTFVDSDWFLGYDTRNYQAAPYLIFDVDSSNDLEEARRQTVALTDVIKELVCEYRGKDKPLKKHKISLGIVFSGAKGFHVYVPTGLVGPQISFIFKKIAQIIKDRYSLSCLDTVIYEPERVIRVPGSINKKTGNLCCVISEKMLRTKTAEQICDYSQRLKAYLIAQETNAEKIPRRPKLYCLPGTYHNTLKLPIFVSRLCMTRIAPYKESYTFGDKTFWRLRSSLNEEDWIQLSRDLDQGLERWGQAPVTTITTESPKKVKGIQNIETKVVYPTEEFVNFLTRTVEPQHTMSFPEAVRYVKTIDFRELFGLPTNGRSFSCWYHEDHNPSATVVRPCVETPVWLYRCYANGAEHPYKTIIDLVMDYLSVDFKTAVSRICYALGIEVVEGKNSVAVQEIRDMIEDVCTAIRRSGIRYNTSMGLLTFKTIYELGLSLAEHYDVSPEGFYFGASTKEIAKLVGYEQVPNRIVTVINLIHCLGLIRKVDPDEVPAWYRNNVVINGLRQARGTEINYYQLTADWNIEDILNRYRLWISAGGRNDNARHHKLAEVFGIENIPAYEIAAIVDVYNALQKRSNVSEEKKEAFGSFIQELVEYRREHASEQIGDRLRRAAEHHQTGRGDTSVTITQRFEVCVVLHNIRECMLARYLRRIGYLYAPRYYHGDYSFEYYCRAAGG